MKFFDTFKPFIINKSKESAAIHLKTEGDNTVKDQTEVAEILANYFTNVASSIGGDHEIKSRKRTIVTTAVRTIRETHKETNFEFKLLTVAEVEGHWKRLIQRSLVDGTRGYHQNYLRMWLKEQQHR